MVIERLRALQRNYERERDANRKQDILEQMLALVRVGWEQLFATLCREGDPWQLLLLIEELNRLFEQGHTPTELTASCTTGFE